MTAPAIPLIGYSDRLSVRPGERIAFKVSSRLEAPYEARLVRVTSADPNPDGPGLREEALPAAFAGRYPSRVQEMRLGSYMVVEDARALGTLPCLAVTALARPTLPDRGLQAVVSLRAREGGVALCIDGKGRVALALDSTEGEREIFPVEGAIPDGAWLRVWACLDLLGGRAEAGWEALDQALARKASARWSIEPRAALAPESLTVAVLDAATGEGLFNGRIEAPALYGHAEPSTTEADALARWDFGLGIEGFETRDRGLLGLHGQLVNRPLRAVKGAAWTGEEMCWRHRPEHYAAIHFHEDDFGDAGWETDFEYEVPADLPSGLYAVRLSGDGVEDSIPFIVPPPKGERRADLCVVIPTFTYVVYGNHARVDFSDAWRERAADWGASPWNPCDHPEFGLSAYNKHADGSGIALVTHLRPMLTLRLGYITLVDQKGSGLRHLQADTHILAWLEAKGHSYDLLTDHDLDEEGAAALAGYAAVFTSSHPEYHTGRTWDAFKAYRDGGGRLAYLGGNGFYWRVARHPEHRDALELRRAEGGIRAWAAEPGEYYHAFDGAYGGLWRRNGRPPQQLVGVGFSAQGLFEGTCYRRAATSYEQRFSWLFDGLEGEQIGCHSLSGGGAAGFELDRAEAALGTDRNAVVLASSSGHPGHFTVVFEELLSHVATLYGDSKDDLVRADMVYWETPSGGAVFSAGSITFCGALPVDDFDSDVSRLVDNLLTHWLSGRVSDESGGGRL